MREGERNQHGAAPPGLPLFQAAERARGAMKPVPTKRQWAATIGIGNVTYDRLENQANPPQAKTVAAIAKVIGISYEDAAQMAGLIKPGVAGKVHGPFADLPAGLAGAIYMAGGMEAERHIQALRKAGHETGRTLGDVLVMTGLAEPRELKLTREPDVEDVEDDLDLPDDVKKQLVDGYRRLRADIAETVRSHKGR